MERREEGVRGKECNSSQLVDGKEEEGTLSLLFKRHVQDWEVGVVIQFTEFIHKVRVQEARRMVYFGVLSPTKEIWGTCAPMKTSSFPWDAKWGKILTIDVLNQMKMVNYQQMLANHILIHCKGYGQKKEEDVEYGFSLLVLVCSVKETKGSSMEELSDQKLKEIFSMSLKEFSRSLLGRNMFLC
ncbi:hypothetical protein CK203_005136 [Vitis vinifera]|uniref:Uncharacterized protein n=1 Tax=Vitis vinifera TaxID=29760 RepID=A0A438KEH3_VITVI|nr:hypothetical protein CK203_005136 [Vitis vinifera]